MNSCGYSIFPKILFWLVVGLLLSGCNLPRRARPVNAIDVTQAYQTVAAQLTQAVTQTPTITATIVVDEPSTATPENQATQAPPQAPGPEPKCDQAAAAYPKIDITIEDDTVMAPGENFTKIWRVVNKGTCTWTPGYAVVWFSGVQFSTFNTHPLNVSVSPGQSVDLVVDMVAPAQTGTHQSNWKLRNGTGELFGIGPNGESPFWVRIKVVGVATETPTPSPSPTATPAVQASGTTTLVISDTLDLDHFLVNTGDVDIEFQTTITTPFQHQLIPLGGATLAVFGGGQPSLNDCQTANLSPDPIDVGSLAPNTTLCYRTDLGLPGWARVESVDTSVGTITLRILTWKLP